MPVRGKHRGDPVEASSRFWKPPKTPLPQQMPPVQKSLEVERRVSDQAQVSDCCCASAPSELVELVTRIEEVTGLDDDGYFKLIPGNDSKSWYIKYNWTRGQFNGTYVMVVCYRGALAEGLSILCNKVAEVRAGTRFATVDRYYK